MKKPSVTQRMTLGWLSTCEDGTDSFDGRSMPTIRACERRGWVEYVGYTPIGWRRYRITEKGREALREVTG